jgi:signal recognition particle GTPase
MAGRLHIDDDLMDELRADESLGETGTKFCW